MPSFHIVACVSCSDNTIEELQEDIGPTDTHYNQRLSLRTVG